MKTQKHKIFGCLLLIGAIVVSVGFALPETNAGFGETITTAQMANMFGGGFTCPQNDCEGQATGCPESTSCEGYAIGHECTVCLDQTKLEQCGAMKSQWGLMCTSDDNHNCTTSGVKGACALGGCLKNAEPNPEPCPGGEIAQCKW